MLLPFLLLALMAVAPTDRGTPDGSGPFLAPLDAAADEAPARRAPLRTETWIDLEASLFAPGKADPNEWMATGTWARITYDGISHQYGYDPLTQSYDMMVSGYVDAQYGILAQETVGILAVPLPGALIAGRIERVEVRFHVREHNLFPFEQIGITAMTDEYTPRSNLNSLHAQLLYEDARGFTGNAYVLDHFAVGPHAIDLGSVAVADLEQRLQGDDPWFGVGFAADGWDLSQSWGTQVFWRVDGGGRLPETIRPLVRVVFNAAPTPPHLAAPAADETVYSSRPVLSWQASTDLNGDTPVTYRVLVGTDPLLTAPVVFDAGAATSAQPPLPLTPASYFWAVEASDPQGATNRSGVQRFVVASGTDAPVTAGGPSLEAAPNPFNPRTVLTARIPIAGAWSLALHDGRGRRVRTFPSRELAPGSHRWTWDGEDATGAPVASGVYHATLSGPDGRRSRVRLTLVR